MKDYEVKENQLMAQIDKEKLRKQRHDQLKAAAVRLIKHEVQERAKIKDAIKARLAEQQMLLQKQLYKKSDMMRENS